MKNKLIILTGPTAVGKTALSVELAKKINGEIISADSMQVYKRMNIGTAKVTEEEKQGIPHFLIDELEPYEDFNVYEFKQRAQRYINEISLRGHIPIIVGGTGFYIQSVLYDIDFKENKTESSLYSELTERYLSGEASALFDELTRIDPDYAETIHINDMKRLINALCFYNETGIRLSEHNATQRAKDSQYDFRYFVLTDDRSKIYDRIEKRVDKMILDGLVDEVKGLINEGLSAGMVSMQGLGYKEIYAYLNGEISLEEAVYIIKRDTRHFAKRQLTWFKREKDVIMINRSDYKSTQDMLSYMLKLI